MKRESIYISSFILFLIVYLLFLIYIGVDSNEPYDKDSIELFSWLGIAVVCYIFISYYHISKTYFSLYTIFIILSFLFFYGQCFLWAFGIHWEDEISNEIYNGLKITNVEIIRTQLFLLSCLLAFHTSFIVFIKKIRTNNFDHNKLSIPNDKYLSSIYNLSFVLCFVVLPITFYNLINQFITAQISGYYSLYYGDDVQKSGSILTIGQMFFVCLLGLLIGSRYKKKVVYAVYIIFAFYLLIDLASGDRGGWFYRLLILIWMHHYFYKPFTKKFLLKSSVFVIIALYIIQAIVIVRNSGVNIDSITDAFSFEKNPIVTFIAEMGGSMKVLIVSVNKDLQYPYGNSILLGLLAMVTMKIPAFLGIDYVPITDWFSWDYLGLNYGAGFSIYAEMAINFGVLISPCLFFLIGLASTKILNVSERISSLSSLKLLFMIGTSSFLISSIRNTFHDLFKYWFLGCFIFIILIYFYYHFTSKRTVRRAT